jgi:hypothetical protein
LEIVQIKGGQILIGFGGDFYPTAHHLHQIGDDFAFKDFVVEE